MASNLKVIIDNQQTKIKIPSGTRMLVRRSCHAVMEHEGYSENAEINVVFADNELMNSYTDLRVSSIEAPELVAIPSDGDGEDLGKIILSVERVYELVNVYNCPYEMGIVYSAVHGVLNLLGEFYYDKETREKLRIKEARIMSELGFAPLANYGQVDA